MVSKIPVVISPCRYGLHDNIFKESYILSQYNIYGDHRYGRHIGQLKQHKKYLLVYLKNMSRYPWWPKRLQNIVLLISPSLIWSLLYLVHKSIFFAWLLMMAKHKNKCQIGGAPFINEVYAIPKLLGVGMLILFLNKLWMRRIDFSQKPSICCDTVTQYNCIP